MSEFEVPFPVRGLNKAMAFTKQPPATTRDALNMRSTDPSDDRVKGAQREGLSKLCSTAIVEGAPVRDVAVVVYDSTHITYSVVTSFKKAVPDEPQSFIRDCVTDKYGTIYAVGNGSQLLKFTPDGVLQERLTVTIEPSAVSETAPKFCHVVTDDLGTIWVGAVTETTRSASVDPNGILRFHQVLYCFEDGDEGLTFKWRALGGNEATSPYHGWSVQALKFHQGRLYAVLYGRGNAASNPGTIYTSWLVGWDAPTGFPEPDFRPDDPFNSGGTAYAGTLIPVFAQSFTTNLIGSYGPLDLILAGSVAGYKPLLTTSLSFNSLGEYAISAYWPIASGNLSYGAVKVFDQNANLVYSFEQLSDLLGVIGPNYNYGSLTNGGVSHLAEWIDDNALLTAGPVLDNYTGVNGQHVVIHSYNRSAAVWTVDHAVDYTAPGPPAVGSTIIRDDNISIVGRFHPYHAVRDAFGNCFVPISLDSGTSTSSYVYRVEADSTEEQLLVGSKFYSSAAIPPTNPDYGDELITLPQEVWAGCYYTTINGIDNTFLVSQELVSASQTGGSPRSFRWVAVAGSALYTFDSTSVTTPSGGVTIADENAQYVGSAQLFGEVFYTDGLTYFKYDPKENVAAKWEAETAGTIPRYCRLICSWRGRIVLARGTADPYNWHMSAINDPYDWNEFRVPTEATQAVSGNSADLAGRVPDIINTLIPYNDDLLLFGCDHSIYRMTGDPMSGGFVDLVSDKTGMSFGRPWSKDPSGVVYFFGSRGGVYRMAPNGQPVTLSDDRLPTELRDVDLSSFHVRLAWDDEREALRVFVIPYGSGGSLVSHYVWEKSTNSWWIDQHGIVGNTSRQPTCVEVFDGDGPDDRFVVLGCEDGYVRRLDYTATDDDGLAIDSYVTIGPMVYGDKDKQLRFSRLWAVLSNNGAGATWRLYVSDQPDTLPSAPQASGSLTAGRNRAARAKGRGYAAWLQLRNANLNERWGVESLMLSAVPAGRLRTRT